jgi:hypothetical protein
MTKSLQASKQGLAIIDQARQRQGWTKTSTARWWQDAHTSRATLRRFWQGDRIQREIFIAICQAVGVSDWEAIADADSFSHEPVADIANSTPYLDWYEAPDVEHFYGREPELAQLERWITQEQCKVVTVTGLPGIGKTALALALVDRIQTQFAGLIWKSLHVTPSITTLLDSLLNTLGQPATHNIQQNIQQLVKLLRQRQYLLILDGLDAVSEQDKDQYIYFIQQLNRNPYKSCIVITSRKKLSIELNTIHSCSLALKGLSETNALQLLHFKQVTGSIVELKALIRLYSGHPLALKLVIPFIQSVFDGNTHAFLSQNTVLIGHHLQTILKQQFAQLSAVERDIIYWLAIWQEPISLCRLQSHLLSSVDSAELIESIAGLEQRSLLEKWIGAESTSFTLQPLLMKVVMDELVGQIIHEIQQITEHQDIQHAKILRTHCLLRPGTDDIAGDRLLTQLREKLWRLYGVSLAESLRHILSRLETHTPWAIGYIGYNIASLLKLIGV